MTMDGSDGRMGRGGARRERFKRLAWASRDLTGQPLLKLLGEEVRGQIKTSEN